MKKTYILFAFFLLTSISCGSNFLSFDFFKPKKDKVLEDFAKGFIYLSYNKTDEGVKYLQEGNKYLKDPSIDLYIARTYFKNGEIDKALNYALKAYEKTKDDRIARFILMAYLRKKDYKNILEFSLQAYQDHPEDKIFLHILSIYLSPEKVLKMAEALENQDPAKAIVFYKLAGDIANKSNPKLASQAYYRAGLLYVYVLEYDKAISLFKKAYNLEPNNLEYINALAYTYLLNNKIEEAKPYVKKLESRIKDIKNPSILDTLAYYYYKKGDYKKALEYEKQALNKNTSNGILYAHLSMIYYKLGDLDEAKKYAKIALNILKINPSQVLGEKETIKYLHKILGIYKKDN